MLQETINNEYEILFVTEDLELIRTVRPICVEKAKKICEILTSNTREPVFWFNNIHNDEIEIYTKKSNILYAKKFLDAFEYGYRSTLRKHEMIINHRHKKC